MADDGLWETVKRWFRPLMKSHSTFISYRRKGGGDLARLIKQGLKARGVAAFLDVENLSYGDWRHQLAQEIEKARSVVVVLTEDCLEDRADDVMRYEIDHAMRLQRIIIPVFKPEFRSIWSLATSHPEWITDIYKNQGVEYAHEHYEERISKLVYYMS